MLHKAKRTCCSVNKIKGQIMIRPKMFFRNLFKEHTNILISWDFLVWFNDQYNMQFTKCCYCRVKYLKLLTWNSWWLFYFVLSCIWATDMKSVTQYGDIFLFSDSISGQLLNPIFIFTMFKLRNSTTRLKWQCLF